MARDKNKEYHRCADCANCTPVTTFHTLNINGEPTLGRCPYWTESKSCLLSWMHECRYFRKIT